MPDAIPPVSVFRLRFIDMARAVAILLMLEGHFVDVTLAPEWRVPGHFIHDSWMHVRGMAAPMFFTVTGVVFAYLLSGAREPGFFKVHRVRRGIVRAVELFVWGYLLQVDLRLLPRMLHGEWDPWFQAFHVLQCIGFGLLVMIGMFGLLRKAGPRVLAASYIAIGFTMFLLAVILANTPGPLPHNAPAWLQNPLKGINSLFPLAPWLGFTLYGAAIGVLVRMRSEARDRGMSPLPFLAIGILLKSYGWTMDRWLGGRMLDMLGYAFQPRVVPDAFHGRIGEILLVLGALVWLEKHFRPGAHWFQTIGRNTFPVYVSHAILLYGAIFGIGLNDWLEKSLNPWQAALGAVLFCGFFALYAQWMEPLALRWKAWRRL
jgi:surface polysaccharide O-acyltransferase-like enzyme